MKYRLVLLKVLDLLIQIILPVACVLAAVYRYLDYAYAVNAQHMDSLEHLSSITGFPVSMLDRYPIVEEITVQKILDKAWDGGVGPTAYVVLGFIQVISTIINSFALKASQKAPLRSRYNRWLKWWLLLVPVFAILVFALACASDVLSVFSDETLIALEEVLYYAMWSFIVLMGIVTGVLAAMYFLITTREIGMAWKAGKAKVNSALPSV